MKDRMIMKKICLISLLFILYGCAHTNPHRQSTLSDALYGFENIQDSARTKVWWFHGETETTREGITADLEAFRKAGVGGVVFYDQVHLKKPVALDAFSDEWWAMLYYAAREAERLGLTFETHISNGFVAGGPWITKELGMQMLTASDTLIQGGKNFSGNLPLPANANDYYRDVAVLAFPVSREQWLTSDDIKPTVTSNLTELPAADLFSPNAPAVEIPAQPSGKSVFVNLDFHKDFTARSITYQVRPRGKATTSATNVPAPPGDTFVGTGYRVLPDLGSLEVSDDGIHYTTVCALKPIYRAHSQWKQKTIAFPPATGRYFRLNLHDWYMEDDRRPGMQLGNVTLSPQAKADQWEEKNGLFSEYIEKDNTPSYTTNETIRPDRITDLSHLLKPDGSISWDVPAGDWVIMRFVHVPTGSKTKHGRPNLMGLECDKMSSLAATVQWNNYFKVISDSLAKHHLPLHGMAMDSHEAGSQNWTPGFDKEFHKRRGYDLKHLLPAMMGHIIGTSEETNGILYDVRRTIADLITDNYYGTLNKLCQESGVSFTAQATGNALCIVADPIQAKGKVDIPQGEFWAIHPDGNYDIKESSSAAHLYGKKTASAEAFTDAKFSHSLAYLKTLADYAYCYGINEFVVCASAYQPWLDKIPGNTGGGRHYCLNRNNTFWDFSKPFWDYQARCAYIMRQGMPLIDLCVYLGENAPVKILTHRLPDIPGGFDFDAFTSDALFTRMSAKNGQIALPDGMSYRMMILPGNGEITLEALKKIADLVNQGISVYGTKARYSETFADIGKKKEYEALAHKLWGKETPSSGYRHYGKGTVYWGMPLEEAVYQAGLQPDIKMEHASIKQEKVWFAHRQLKDADVYFLNNHKDTAVDDIFTFRSSGKIAELWNPMSGQRYTLPTSSDRQGHISVHLKMAAWESYFLTLSDTGSGNLPLLHWDRQETVTPVSDDWSIYFDPAMGGPGEVKFDSLSDWALHPDPSIKYYSGTALYRKTLNLQKTEKDEKALLRFSELGSVARVIINGQDMGIVWCSPWEIDVTNAIHDGENELEIHVANSLMNRMILDSQLPVEKRITYSYPEIASPKDALIPSGIIKGVDIIYKK